jgi:RNase P/RNase MRP subunit p29
MNPSNDSFADTFVKKLLQQGTSSSGTRTPLQAAQEYQATVVDKVLSLDATTESRKIARIRSWARRQRQSGDADGADSAPPVPAVRRHARVRGKRVRWLRARPRLQRSRAISFESMKRVNRLWREYIDVLRGPNELKSGSALRDKVMRADLHGALIRVVQSRNVTAVGLCGFVLVETKLAFQIVTRANAVKQVPKAHTVFDVHHPVAIFRFYGSQLQSHAAERSTKKLKAKRCRYL